MNPDRRECPLKPGVFCRATEDLAAASRCYDCPLIDQFALIALYLADHPATA